MKRTKAQIDNLLEDIAQFTIILGSSDYYINYEPRNLNFSSFERAVNENLKYWNAKNKSGGFYHIWQDIGEKISKIKEYLETVDDNPESKDNILNYLYSNLSSDRINSDSGCVYRVYVDSPIISDTKWLLIDKFIDFYIKNVDNGDGLPDAIRNYTSLYRNPINVGYYLSQSSNHYYYPALFILKNTLSPKGRSVKTFEQKTLQPIREKLDQLFQDADKNQQEVTRFIEERRSEIQSQIDKNTADMDAYRSKIDDWKKEKDESLGALEDTYRNKLQLEAPEKLWNDRSGQYRKRANRWTCGLVAVAAVLLIVITFFVQSLYGFPKGVSEKVPFLSQQVLFIGAISFLVYIVRIVVKIVMSSHHIAMEYEQKAALTRFYQALTYGGVEVSENEKLIIISALFSKADTGLVKVSDSVDMDNVLSLIAKSPGK